MKKGIPGESVNLGEFRKAKEIADLAERARKLVGKRISYTAHNNPHVSEEAHLERVEEGPGGLSLIFIVQGQEYPFHLSAVASIRKAKL